MVVTSTSTLFKKIPNAENSKITIKTHTNFPLHEQKYISEHLAKYSQY